MSSSSDVLGVGRSMVVNVRQRMARSKRRKQFSISQRAFSRRPGL